MNIEKKMFEKNKTAIKKILLAAKQSSYYQKLFENNGIVVENIESYEDFVKIPILDKSTYASNKYEMIADSSKSKELMKKLLNLDNLQDRRRTCEEYGIYLKVTSGSTGKPLEILKAKDDLLREYMGLNLARMKTLGKLPIGKYVWIWPANKKIREYFYEDGNISVFQDTEYGYKYMMPEYSIKTFQELCEFIINNDISWITAPPSMLYNFARYVEEKNMKIVFSYIECHSEKLFNWQSQYVEKIFGSHPVSVYSSNEVQFMGITDENDQMRVISSNVFLELIDDEEGHGIVFATSLSAFNIPIIRYCLGDIAQWNVSSIEDKNGAPCIELKGYRNNDYILTKDGRKFEPFFISDLMILLNDFFRLNINEYVVQQDDFDSFTFYFKSGILGEISCNEEIHEYIIQFIKNIINVEITVGYRDMHELYDRIGTKKFKYFIGKKNE